MDFRIGVCMIRAFFYMHLTFCYCYLIRNCGVLISAHFTRIDQTDP